MEDLKGYLADMLASSATSALAVRCFPLRSSDLSSTEDTLTGATKLSRYQPGRLRYNPNLLQYALVVLHIYAQSGTKPNERNCTGARALLRSRRNPTWSLATRYKLELLSVSVWQTNDEDTDHANIITIEQYLG